MNSSNESPLKDALVGLCKEAVEELEFVNAQFTKLRKKRRVSGPMYPAFLSTWKLLLDERNFFDDILSDAENSAPMFRTEIEQLVEIVGEIDAPARAEKVASPWTFSKRVDPVMKRQQLRELVSEHWDVVDKLEAAKRSLTRVQNFREELLSNLEGPEFTKLFKIFCCYSDADWDCMNEVVTFLKGQLEPFRLKLWYDHHIPPGRFWHPSIEEAIDSSDLAIVLVSEALLNTEFVRQYELPRLLDNRLAGGMYVLPVILEECNWKAGNEAWLAESQALPGKKKTVRAEFPDTQKRQEFIEKELSSAILDLMLTRERVKKIRTTPAGS